MSQTKSIILEILNSCEPETIIEKCSVFAAVSALLSSLRREGYKLQSPEKYFLDIDAIQNDIRDFFFQEETEEFPAAPNILKENILTSITILGVKI